jgi:hypothetical protein
MQGSLTISYRPAIVSGVDYAVSRFSADYPVESATALLEFLSTTDGFTLIDPDTVNFPETLTTCALNCTTQHHMSVDKQPRQIPHSLQIWHCL